MRPCLNVRHSCSISVLLANQSVCCCTEPKTDVEPPRRANCSSDRKIRSPNLIIGYQSRPAGFVYVHPITCQDVGGRHGYGRSKSQHLGDEPVEKGVDFGKVDPGRCRRGRHQDGPVPPGGPFRPDQRDGGLDHVAAHRRDVGAGGGLGDLI